MSVEVETIYRLAKAKDKEALTAFLANDVCVDVAPGEFGDFSAVAMLAKEGDHESVNFLLEHFDASVTHAAFGYACMADDAAVKRMLEAGASVHHVVAGYAYYGHKDQVNRLLQAHKHIKHIVDVAVHSYAWGAHEACVQDLLKRGARLGEAIFGAALGNQTELLKQLVSSDENFQENLSDAAYGHARRGDKETVDKLLACGASRKKVVSGYARGSHVSLAMDMVGHGVNFIDVIFGLAYTGHTDMVRRIHQGRPDILHEAAFSFARGGHIRAVNHYVAMGADKSAVVQAYQYGHSYDNPMHTLRLVALSEDQELKEMILADAKAKNNAFDVKAIRKEADRIASQMKAHNQTFYQAKGDVAALKNKLLIKTSFFSSLFRKQPEKSTYSLVSAELATAFSYYIALTEKVPGATEVLMTITSSMSVSEFYQMITNNSANELFNLNARGRAGNTALHVACQVRNIPLARALLAAGVCFDIENADGMTPLDYAINAGSLELVSMLVEAGANIEYAGEHHFGEMPEPMANYLKACTHWGKRALPNRPETCAGVANMLRKAVEENDCSEVRKLFANKIVRLWEGYDAVNSYIRFAAKKGFMEMVEILAAHGDDLMSADGVDRKTTPKAAREAGHAHIADFLEAKQSTRYAALRAEAAKDRVEKKQAFLVALGGDGVRQVGTLTYASK